MNDLEELEVSQDEAKLGALIEFANNYGIETAEDVNRLWAYLEFLDENNGTAIRDWLFEGEDGRMD